MTRVFQTVRAGWTLGLALAGFPLRVEAIPPGGVLPDAPELAMARGTLSGSAVAPDGTVLLRGDFTHVNGIPRPGLAKLLPNGRLDAVFEPEAVAISGPDLPSGVIMLGTPVSEPLVPLSDGTWVHSFPSHPLAYRPDGTRDLRYSFLSGHTGAPEILFETDSILYMFRGHPDGRRLEAYRRGTFERLPMADPASWPQPAVQAVPAADGRLWVLGREELDGSGPILWSQPPYVLFRVDADGALDPSFPPREFSRDRGYRILPRAGGAFRLIHWDDSWIRLWPSTPRTCYEIEAYDDSGALIHAYSRCDPFGSLLLAEESDGSLLLKNTEIRDGQIFHELVRIHPDGTEDPDFRVALDVPVLHLLPDGRIHHSHVRRILPNGTPDPTWQAPDLATDPAATVLGTFADGGILIHRDLAPDGPAEHPLIVLDSSFQPDPAFQPPLDLPAAQSYQFTRDRQSLLVPLRGIHDFPDGTQTRILRLRRDGTIDPDSPRYLPRDGSVWAIPGMEPVYSTYIGSFHVAPLPGGAMLVHYMLPDREVPSPVWQRLLSDGTPDPAFAFAGERRWFSGLFALDDGSFLLGQQLFAPDGSLRGTMDFPPHSTPMLELPDGRLVLRYFRDNNAQQLALWDLDSGVDPGFQSDFLDGTRINQVVPLPGDAWLVEGRLSVAGGFRRMVRLHADGRVDPTFVAPHFSRTLPWTTGLWNVVQGGEFVSAAFANRRRDARLNSLTVLPDFNALLVAGDFTHLDSHPRTGLGLLSLRRLETFQEWRECLLPGMPEEEAARHLEDYAAGADPSDPARPRGFQASPEAGREFRLFLNPDAADVAIDFDVSDDLRDWRSPLPGELTATEDPRGLRLGLTDAGPALFLRTRYRIEVAPSAE